MTEYTLGDESLEEVTKGKKKKKKKKGQKSKLSK